MATSWLNVLTNPKKDSTDDNLVCSPRASMMGMFLDDAPKAELLAALDALPSADVAARARSKLGLG